MRFLWLIAALLLLTSGFLYHSLSNILHTSQEVTILLAGVPFILAGFIFIKRDSVAQIIQQKIAPTWSRSTFAAYFFTVVAWVSTYLLVAFIFILRISILYQDEWRTHNDYIFERGFWRSLFERQNEHLAIIPSGLYQANYYLFADNEFWLILINTGFMLSIGGLFVYHLYRALRSKWNLAITVLCCSVLGFSVFWLASDTMLFWTVGVSNNLGVLGATLAATVLAKANSLTHWKTLLLFTLCALLASFSFGGGVATWMFGCIAAFFKATDKKVTIGYLVLALIGGLATVGYFALSGGGSVTFSLLDIALIAPTLIGSPFTFLLRPFTAATSLPYIALGIGMAGILWGAFLLYYFFIQRRSIVQERQPKDLQQILFFTLMALFVVGCAILIGFSRGNGDFTYALSDRYN
ncbi:MAG: hypothetical protein AAGJ18_21820, partial [Bacteroidota bacterium]